MDNVRLKGQSSEKGQLLISGKAEMVDFLKRNAGKTILITMQAFGAKTTKAHIGFYFGKIVPDVKQGYKNLGLHLSNDETETRIRELAPMMQPEVNETELKTVYNLDRVQMIEYLDWVKQWSAENLYTFVIEPRLL